MLIAKAPFNKVWNEENAFDEASKLEGKLYRELEARRTLRFEFENKPYFAKIHRGVGWTEIIKNLLQLRLPITSASNEWNAVNYLENLNIETMNAVAYGKWGSNPASVKSFIITEELTNTESLEDVCKDWAKKPPSLAFKRSLINRIGKISKTMHDAGMCHRDYYLCHFHLELNNEENPQLSMIDLHRALIKPKLATRWKIKDVAGLHFSSMDIGLTRNDLYRFMKVYSGKSLRNCLSENNSFWQAVDKRATKLYQKS